MLLDEVEKAHPEVFNVLLQVLDDGRLTDSKGRTIDFRNSLIIMTSNLGTSAEGDSNPDVIREAIFSHFRPEFVNRIDEVIVFDTLGHDLAQGNHQCLDRRTEGTAECPQCWSQPYGRCNWMPGFPRSR